MSADHNQQKANAGLAVTIGKNTVFGMVANVVQVASRLVTVPIVIHHLGLSGYGIWNVIMMTAMYMRFGSVGVKTAFQKYVAEATGDGNYERANILLSTGSAIMLTLSLAGLIPVVFLSARIAKAVGVPPEFMDSGAPAISLLAVIMLMANVGAAFEAIVMGGHRIDLARKFNTVFSILEAIAIVAALHFGYGLAAMAAVMGISELLYLTCCYFASRRVVPQIRLGVRHLSKSVIYELVRFAGSYQLVNLLEVLYSSLIPVALLRSFGGNSAGVYAVITRVVASAKLIQESFLPAILSGGTMVFASGSAERMQALLGKAFKVTLALSLFPLGFVALFGPTMAFAWTGQHEPAFRIAFWSVCARGLFEAFSLLSLVLYRVSGNAVLDNVRQLLRIGFIVAIVAYASKLGFQGVLAGLAISELAGLLFMIFALAKTFHFRADVLMLDTVRVTLAAAIIFGVGAAASHIPIPGYQATRLSAWLELGEAGLACLIVAWPLLVHTGAITANEKRALLASVFTSGHTVLLSPQV